jgi:hypothetical protein
MAIMRAIGAVLAGALTAFVLGAIFDYLQGSMAPDPSKWQYLYPWLMGGVGLISSLVATLVLYPAVTLAATKAALRGTSGHPARQGTGTKPAASTRPEDVPGMPKFDFDAAKREIAAGSTTAPPAAASSSLPSAPLPGAPGSGAGSRPTGSGSTAPQESDKH